MVLILNKFYFKMTIAKIAIAKISLDNSTLVQKTFKR